jgi:hypothetical protein
MFAILLAHLTLGIAIPVSSVTQSHIPDINATPTHRSKPVLSGNSRRRRTLMTLLDVLTELTRDDDFGPVGAWARLHHSSAPY